MRKKVQFQRYVWSPLACQGERMRPWQRCSLCADLRFCPDWDHIINRPILRCLDASDCLGKHGVAAGMACAVGAMLEEMCLFNSAAENFSSSWHGNFQHDFCKMSHCTCLDGSCLFSFLLSEGRSRGVSLKNKKKKKD